MVDIERIRKKILLIEDNLTKLEKISQYPLGEFKNDFMKHESAKHLLQVSIEAMIDIANHIVARERFGVPNTSADSFKLLMENGIISPESFSKYSAMAKFRNRIVHLYGDVDLEEIYRILSGNLDDLKGYIREILIYLSETSR